MRVVTAKAGDLVEVMGGPRAGMMGRVVLVRESLVALRRIEFDDDDNPADRELVGMFKMENLTVEPWPEDVRRSRHALKKNQLARHRAAVHRGQPEPSIRVYSPRVFGLEGGWDT